MHEQATALSDYTNLICWLEAGCLPSTETSKPSPFDYRENVQLYISETAPFLPHRLGADKKNKAYLAAITDEIEKLLRASHGHAAVLFTGYDALGRVYAELSKRRLPFPMFKLEKSTSNAIERFKKSGNAGSPGGSVLFASGAMWEGIDIPGDSLSMLIIVKLPFAVPDPIGEYERLINALPFCFITSKISDLEKHLRLKKSPEYCTRFQKICRFDLCHLLGNILENALELCAKCENATTLL